MRRILALLALLASLTVAAPAALAQAAPQCQFVLGFATIASLIPQAVGHCVDNESHNPLNGDALQHTTTNGLLVWRKSDNWTAFTDGYHSWINGPNGLQERLNAQRFSWEANPDGLPVVGGSSTPILQAAAATPAPQAIGARLQASIGTTVDFQTSFNKTPFHAVVTDAFRTTLIPTTYYAFGGISTKATPAPGNSAFAIFVLTVTNVGNVSDSLYGNEMAVRDAQGRTFTVDQTPDTAWEGAKDFFNLKGPADSLGPSVTDKFVFVYVVAGDSTGLILIPAP